MKIIFIKLADKNDFSLCKCIFTDKYMKQVKKMFFPNAKTFYASYS